MRNGIVGFFLGFILAQAGWWFAARETTGSGDAAGGGASMRFVLLDTVEVLVACAFFALALALVSRTRKVVGNGKMFVLAFVAGATTSTLAAPPSALVPRFFPGDGQFVVDIIAAALVSAAFGWLVASAFTERGSTPAAG